MHQNTALHLCSDFQTYFSFLSLLVLVIFSTRKNSFRNTFRKLLNVFFPMQLRHLLFSLGQMNLKIFLLLENVIRWQQNCYILSSFSIIIWFNMINSLLTLWKMRLQLSLQLHYKFVFYCYYTVNHSNLWNLKCKNFLYINMQIIIKCFITFITNVNAL